MFRNAFVASLVALAALGTVALAMAQEPKQADGGQKQITNSIGMKLTLIPAGEFKMGSGESSLQTATFLRKDYGMILPARPENAFENEHPQHRVRITKPFYLGIYHVTRGQFRRFVNDSGYKTDAENGFQPGPLGWNPKKGRLVPSDDISWRNAGFEQTDEHPVVNVSWRDAMAFCNWLSRREGQAYRLPTEAEWEYACRAGSTTRYYSGDDAETLAKVANTADATFKARFPASPVAQCAIKASDGYVFTSPVGQFKPNDFGLYDMLGNAAQLCADWSDYDYYRRSPTDDPKGPDTGSYHVERGGSWLSCPNTARCAARGIELSAATTGFRVACSGPASHNDQSSEKANATK